MMNSSKLSGCIAAFVGLTGLAAACGGNPETPSDPGGVQATTGVGAGSSTGGSGASSNTGGNAQGGNVSSGGNASGGSVSTGGGTGGLADAFDGSGPLEGYVTNNASALPDVARVDGRYRANLVNNDADVTLHFNDAQGRLDAKLVSFPFEVIARNIGIGTQGDSQTAPAPNGDLYIFAGVQVHVTDLNARNSSHVVVGHRGGTHFTIEGKNTVNGSSSVNDDGANVLPDGRADIRIVGNGDRTISVYWQRPNAAPGTNADSWTPYGGTGSLPGQAPDYGDSVYVGLITYAFGLDGIPFVGTCDAIEAP